jgi:pimeloyl-ACP methyl ester carboxylesterase
MGTLRGLEHVGEGTPVLALHGWLDNAASFIPLMRNLDPSEHWIALDLPGHGQSFHRPDGATYPFLDWLLDIDELVDAMDWKKVAIVGHSMGAGIGALYAASRPERVQHLMMVEGLGPLSNDESATAEKLQMALTPRYRHQDRERLKLFESEEEAAERWAQGFSKVSIDAARLLASRGLEKVEDHYRWSADTRLKTTSLSRLSELQVLDLLRASKEVPKLLVSATAGMFQFASKKDGRIEALAPERHLEVPGGHHCHMDSETATLIHRAWVDLRRS